MIKGKIKSVKIGESVDYVYDISVEDNHNFLANDVIVSNCHHIPSATMNTVAQACKDAYYRIGVSATPWRDSGDDLLIEAVLNKRKPENNINASKLIEWGYLVPASIYFVPITAQFKGKNYHKVYNEAIVNNEYRNNAIVKIALKMKDIKNTTTLILIKNIAHGEKLQKLLYQKTPLQTSIITVKNDKNGKDVAVRVKNIEFLSGKDDAVRRKAVLQGIKEKKIDILIGSTIADKLLSA